MHQFSLLEIPAEERPIAENNDNSGENYGSLLIGDRYRVKHSLGKGTFGEVFLADDLKFDPPRAVAIKILHSKFLNEAGVRHDIAHEASILARFNHPNILRILDFDITSDLAYIVTEVAEGGSLTRKIRPDPTRPPVRQPLIEVARYLDQISDALDEAHDQGLIHRDLKPLNILLDKRNRPLIADFGMATAVSNSQTSSIIEVATSGTPPYMAPEQWMGQISRASDNYALGIIIFQLITGQVPFQGEQAAMGFQHLNAPIPRLSDRAPDLIYPPALDDALAGVLAKDPRKRTRPAREFANQFRAALGLSDPTLDNSYSGSLSGSTGMNTLSFNPNHQPTGENSTVDPNSILNRLVSPSDSEPGRATQGQAGFGSQPEGSQPRASQPQIQSGSDGNYSHNSNPDFGSNSPDNTDDTVTAVISSARPNSPFGWPVRNLVLIGLGAVVVLAILVTALVFSLNGKPDQSPTQVAAAPTNTLAVTTTDKPGSPTPLPGTTAATTGAPNPTATAPKTTAADKGTSTPTTGTRRATPTPGGSTNATAGLIESMKMDSGGKKGGTLNYAFAGAGPTFINPYLSAAAIDQQMATQVYASLVGQSADAKYYPYLLTDIPTLDNGLLKVSPDNKTMTMTLHLKPNAQWSDGSPMTGESLKYTWQWVTDKDNTSFKGDAGGWGQITDITNPDASTAVLKFKQIYGPYLQFLANFYPLPQAVWSKIDFKDDGPTKSPEATKPTVTSGPFTVQEFTDKDHLTLARNNNFSWVWGFNAYLDKLTFRWTDGNTSAIKAFQAGSLDVVDNLNDSTVVTATKAAGDNGKFEMTQGQTWEFLQFNMGNPILQDKAVRQALLMGIERDALIKQFYTPESEPLATTCNPLNAFCQQGLKVYNFNVGTAKKLLTDAGWKEGSDGVRSKDGTRLTITLNTTTSAGPSAVAEVIVTYWKDLGVESKVVNTASGQFYGSWNNNGILKHGNFDVALYAFGGDLDPHSGMYSYVSDYIPSDATKGSGANYGRINDPKIDEAFKTERTTVDLDKRLDAFHDFYQVLYDNIYEAALFSRTDNHLISNKIHNFKANPTGIGNLWNSVELWLG